MTDIVPTGLDEQLARDVTVDIASSKGRDRTLPWRFFLFMAPVLFDTVLQSLSGTIGNIYVGRLLGPHDLAAASAFYPMFLVFISCSVGLGTGASILVGQNWGAGDQGEARTVASAALGVAFALGLAICAFGQVSIRPLLVLFGTPADVLDHAVRYAAAILMGAPGLILLVVTAIILRGAGDSVRPLVMMIVQILTSLLLTPILIEGRFGAPVLGVAGSAAAAVIGWVMALIVVGIWLRLSRHALAPDLEMARQIFAPWRVLRPILQLGLPTMVEIMTMGVAEIALVGRINSFGSDMTAAYGLFVQTLTYIEYPGMAVGITVSVLSAHAIGARDEKEARAVLRLGFCVALALAGGLAAFVTLDPALIASLFTADAHVIALASRAFRVVMWSATPLALAGVLGSAMRASGDAVGPMSLLLGAIICVELPAGYIAAHLYGASGVWFGYPASFSAMFVFTALYWAIRWRHRSLTPIT
ncbi:MATE family efflux transporter [Acetobacter sp. DsW_063]|uniref:MATE family efflux transporter n=1 Tax=Acetobacter sp. DsW_063 TaxID=1514894 RepID=UPI000A3C308E|nr:MATE family efflux transporter [Acetobacter sp. DsW_063]